MKNLTELAKHVQKRAGDLDYIVKVMRGVFESGLTFTNDRFTKPEFSQKRVYLIRFKSGRYILSNHDGQNFRVFGIFKLDSSKIEWWRGLPF